MPRSALVAFAGGVGLLLYAAVGTIYNLVKRRRR